MNKLQRKKESIKKPEWVKNKRKRFAKVYCQDVLRATRSTIRQRMNDFVSNMELCNSIWFVAYTQMTETELAAFGAHSLIWCKNLTINELHTSHFHFEKGQKEMNEIAN